MIFRAFSMVWYRSNAALIVLFDNLTNYINIVLCGFHEVAFYGLIFSEFVLQYYYYEGAICLKIPKQFHDFAQTSKGKGVKTT